MKENEYRHDGCKRINYHRSMGARYSDSANLSDNFVGRNYQQKK